MANRPKLIPYRLLNLSLPLPVFTRLTAHLYSELENRVPHGAYSRFMQEIIRDYFASKELDLAPFINGDPGAFIVRGSPEAMAQLEKALKGEAT